MKLEDLTIIDQLADFLADPLRQVKIIEIMVLREI